MLRTDEIDFPMLVGKPEAVCSDQISMGDLDSPAQIPGQNETAQNPSSSSVPSLSSLHHLAPVNDFKRSLENEKNLNHFMLKVDAVLCQPRGNRSTDRVLAVLEKNYKMQIESLLEETNQLKLDKKILEKRLDFASKGLTGSEVFGRARNNKCNSENCKMTLDAKDSTIKELEFQLAQVSNQNNFLKVANEYQKNEIERMTHDINENGLLRSQIEEYHDEINLLKEKLQMEESKHGKVTQEFQQVKNENISLRLRSQNNSFLELNRLNSVSRDQSILSMSDLKGNRTTAEWTSHRNIKCSELGDSGTKDTVHLNSTPNSIRNKNISLFHHSRKESNDFINASTNNLTRILNSPGTSLKTLNEYERSLLKKKETHPEDAAKISARLVELKKIKAFYLEQENLKLMSVLNKQSSPTLDEDSSKKLRDNRILDEDESQSPLSARVVLGSDDEGVTSRD